MQVKKVKKMSVSEKRRLLPEFYDSFGKITEIVDDFE